jgi:hypothetical protein
MNGEDLYEEWRNANWDETMYHPPAWDDLSDEQQAVWDRFAERLAEVQG